MLLQAVPNLCYLPPGVLSRTFRIASENDMCAFGSTFARAVLPHSTSNSVLRIGLCSGGASGLGKSTFAKGMLKAVWFKTCVEKADAEKSQALWHSPARGWIRQYDCFRGFMNGYLRSYLTGDTSGIGHPRTDIVEHPYSDKNDNEFDYLIFFNYAYDKTDSRLVTVSATPEKMKTEKLQIFFDKHSCWMEEPVNDNRPDPFAVPTRPPAATPT